MSAAALLVGFAIGAVLFSILMFVVVRNVRKSVSDELTGKDTALDELRREAAADRETNRRLRHEMYGLQTGRAMSTATAGAATVGADDVGAPTAGNTINLDQVVAVEAEPFDRLTPADSSEVDRLYGELEQARLQIADREAKLKRYRQALTEIRMSLESRDELNKLVQITEEVPPSAQADASSGVA